MAGHIPDSLSVDWCTEDKYVACVHKTFAGTPDLDPCSNPHSRVGAKTEYMLQNGRDGLVEPWVGASAFVNPPFGKGWWRPASHKLDCTGGARDGSWCECGAAGRREYIWPANRTAKLEALTDEVAAELDISRCQLSAAQYALLTKTAETRFKAWVKPYTQVDIGDWIELAAANGDRMHDGVIGLLPSYPGTKAWQAHVFPKAKRIFFPKGRLHFRLVYTKPDGSVEEKTGPAPMDCAFPLWTCNLYIVHAFEQAFGPHGHIVTP